MGNKIQRRTRKRPTRSQPVKAGIGNRQIRLSQLGKYVKMWIVEMRPVRTKYNIVIHWSSSKDRQVWFGDGNHVWQAADRADRQTQVLCCCICTVKCGSDSYCFGQARSLPLHSITPGTQKKENTKSECIIHIHQSLYLSISKMRAVARV